MKSSYAHLVFAIDQQSLHFFFTRSLQSPIKRGGSSLEILPAEEGGNEGYLA